MDMTLGQTLAAFVSAALGAVLAVSIGVSHKQLCALISFAAGTLLAASVFHIIPEASQAGLPVSSLLLALGSGYALFLIISRYVFHMCPACAASHFEEQEVSKFKNVFFLLAIALTIHSVMDGMAIAFSPHMDSHGHSADHSIFFTIAIHKLPEGLALCALLMKSGHTRAKALIWTLIFETSTILGWVLGHTALEGMTAEWLNLLMVHIAGGFVYLAVHATINEIRDHSPRLILTFFAIGFVFMALVR
jgi:zinc transporter ZupT